ncbi:hypothetical protein MTO96_051480 [Rhipicephalus appendiculatus]
MSKFWEFDSYVDGGDGDKDFSSYVERFEHYWRVTEIEDGSLNKSAFRTALEKRPYSTLEDLMLPAKPDDKPFEDFVSVMKEHYAPGRQMIADRFKFNHRHQLEGQSASACAIELRHMTAKCAFGSFLDEALGDRFVAGLSNPAIQATLLEKKELSFETACDLAKAAELAERESKGFRPPEGNAQMEEAIHAVSKKGRPQRKLKVSAPPVLDHGENCHRCGDKHQERDRKYRKTRCHWRKNIVT